MRTRCPHCRQPVEIVEADPLVEIECLACGSSFSLVTGGTETYGAGKLQTVGHFELLEELGHGSFGSVWKAHDGELDRLVAVKLPRREQLDEVETERFLREARTAAQLDHPGIVGVHEVGNEEGQVYIVSDFVHGATLSEWAEARAVSQGEAVELLADVAEALEHAHRRGVVHRDLKPGNILIDGEGKPHLTDFGLAKRDAGEITMTVEGQVLGTPSYMSPEAARGEGHQLDARADVYSLGVILFELLTGELPFRGSSRMMIMQIINDEPPSPRKLKAGVPRDLETIILKCLEKDPARRYQSAGEFAADLRRTLAGEPIKARPVGRLERLWRWCRRNPQVAALAVITTLALIAGLAVSTWFAIRQSIARDRAEENLTIALEAVNGMLTEVGSESLDDVPLAEPVREELLETAVALMEQIRSQSPSDPRIRFEVARAYAGLAHLYHELGDDKRSYAAYQQAIEGLRRLAGEFPRQPKYRHELAMSHTFLGELLRELGTNVEEAESHYRDALALQQELLEFDDNDAAFEDYLREYTRTLNNHGLLLTEISRHAQGLEKFDEATRGLERLAQLDEGEPEYRSDLARTLINRGLALEGLFDTAEAARSYVRAIRICRRLVDEHSHERLYRHRLGIALYDLGGLMLDQPSLLEGAVPVLSHADLLACSESLRLQLVQAHFREAYEIFYALQNQFPGIPVYRQELANACNCLANLCTMIERYREARFYFDEALKLLGEVEQRFSGYAGSRAEFQSVYGTTLGARGWMERKSGEEIQACEHVAQAVRHQSRAVRLRPSSQNYRGKLRSHCLYLVEILLSRGERDQALRRLREFLENDFLVPADLDDPVLAPLRSDKRFREMLHLSVAERDD